MASPDVVMVLVGNKSDLDEDREVTFLEASKYGPGSATCVARQRLHIGLREPRYLVGGLRAKRRVESGHTNGALWLFAGSRKTMG